MSVSFNATSNARSTGGSSRYRELNPGVLDLSFGRITDADLRRSIFTSDLIHTLNLKGNFLITDEGLRPLQRLINLHTLDLAECRCITGAALAHLAGLVLSFLILAECCNISDDGLQHISHLPYLIHLDLSGCNITDAGLSRLAGLHLRHLNLARCRITDTGLMHLADLPLNHLNLSECYITDRGVERLVASLPTLTDLDLHGCPNITNAAIQRLLMGKPNLTIFL